MIAGVATLRELEEWYSLTDISDRCDALDAVDEAQARQYAKAEAESKKGRQ